MTPVGTALLASALLISACSSDRPVPVTQTNQATSTTTSPLIEADDPRLAEEFGDGATVQIPGSSSLLLRNDSPDPSRVRLLEGTVELTIVIDGLIETFETNRKRIVTVPAGRVLEIRNDGEAPGLFDFATERDAVFDVATRDGTRNE